MIQLEMLQSLTNAFPPQRRDVPDPGPDGQGQMGFFTDTTLCIGCKACEVACKQWNQLPSDGFKFTGKSYDNTEQLSATTWRHVAFQEQIGETSSRWLMMSRCLQALRRCALSAVLPDRRDYLQRVRQCLRSDRHLQRLRLLHRRLPVRRAGAKQRRRPRAQMHAVL